MAIRLRTVNGLRVALCAAETDEMAEDAYLDDDDHYALAAKFARDFETSIDYSLFWSLADSQKVREAKETLEEWLKSLPEVDLSSGTLRVVSAGGAEK